MIIVCVRCTLLPKAIGENRFEFAQTNRIGMKSKNEKIEFYVRPTQNNSKQRQTNQ